MVHRSLKSLVGRWAAPVLLLLLRLTGRRAGVALLYHRVGERQGDSAVELVPPLALATFRGQLRHLQRHYEVVPVERFLDAIASRRRGGRFPVCLTFDDDVSEHVLHAAPELRASGAPAMFFLCGSFLERQEPFWWQHLQRAHDRRMPMARVATSLDLGGSPEDLHRVAETMTALTPDRRAAAALTLRELAPADSDAEMLSAEQACWLLAAGCDVGFHTRRHDCLPELDDVALARALRDGRSELEAFAGRRIDVIAYPHGRVDRRVADAARAAGFTLGFTAQPSAVMPESDPLLAGRFTPTGGSLGEFALGLVRRLLEL